jgi:putative transposase
MDKLVETLGITGLSKSQVSVMAKELDTAVETVRNRPLDAGPYTFMAVDALVLKVREAGRVVNVHALLWPPVSTPRATAKSCAWMSPPPRTAPAGLTFLRSLTARGLSGVRLISKGHTGFGGRELPVPAVDLGVGVTVTRSS